MGGYGKRHRASYGRNKKHVHRGIAWQVWRRIERQLRKDRERKENPVNNDEIRNTFRYHSPNPESVKTHEAIREKMTETVIDIAGMIPHSRERSVFITLMQQAQMMANAAVAIHSPEATAPRD